MRLFSTNVLAAALLCGACATVKETPQVRMDSQPVNLSQLPPAEVARAAQITMKNGSTIYRAPTLSVSKEVDLRRGGPGLSVNLSTTTMGRMGFLFGEIVSPRALSGTARSPTPPWRGHRRGANRPTA